VIIFLLVTLRKKVRWVGGAGLSHHYVRVRVMVFDATFNNISAISWRFVLLVEETVVPGENH
jgi:hypothetical protein